MTPKAILCMVGLALAACAGPVWAAGRPFSVADDIALTYFGDQHYLKTEALTTSPDGSLVVVHAEHGDLAHDRMVDELRVYSTAALREFVLHPERMQAPSPMWSVQESTYSEGPLVTSIHWLRDSSGFAFLLKTDTGKNQLFLEALPQQHPRALTAVAQDITAFAVRDAAHYIYTVKSVDVFKRQKQASTAPASVLTGRSFSDIMFPDYAAVWEDRSDLWVAAGGPAHRLNAADTGRPIVVFDEGQICLALSPDGNTLATSLPVEDVPADWERDYPPPYPGYPYHVRAGHQDPAANSGAALISQYVTIDLHSGKIHSVAAAPTAARAGWVAGGLPSGDKARQIWPSSNTTIGRPVSAAFNRCAGPPAATQRSLRSSQTAA